MKSSYKLEDLLPLSIFQDSSISISEKSIINEVKSVSKLVPLEIELMNTVIIDKSILDFDALKKSKSITFFALCSYSVDLSSLTTEDIFLDSENKIINLYIPSPKVYSIEILDDKTIYEDSQLGFLRFGDILLSSEEYGIILDLVTTEFENNMKSSDLINQAVNNTSIILEDLLKKLTYTEYSIHIKLKN